MGMINLKPLKNQLVLFLVCFAVTLWAREKNMAFLSAVAIAVIFTAAIESFITYFRERKFVVTASSIISGLIIGFVLSAGQPIGILALASFFAIVSKRLIRVKGRHLFNPAALGIFLTTILFGAQTQWEGTYAWYILVPFGLYFVYKIKKLELMAGYFLASFLLFGVQAVMRHIPLGNIFGYFSYFYVFVMMIEPKTTPIKPLGKLIFGLGIGVIIFILDEVGVKFDAELCALLIMNLAVFGLNKLPMQELR